MLSIGSASGLLGLSGNAQANASAYEVPFYEKGMAPAKGALTITDLKCAIIGGSFIFLLLRWYI